MNTDDTRFDRLVDDALDEDERREVLGRLDDEPDGWRRPPWRFSKPNAGNNRSPKCRCARSSSAAPQNATTKVGETPGSRSSAPRRSPWLGRLSTLSAMAASFGGHVAGKCSTSCLDRRCTHSGRRRHDRSGR